MAVGKKPSGQKPKLSAQSHSAQDQKQLQIFKRFAEESIEGFACVDHEGRIQYANNTFANLAGFDSPEDLIGSLFDDYYDKSTQHLIHEKLLPHIQKTGSWTGELILLNRKTGPLSTHNHFLDIQNEDDTPGCIAWCISDLSLRRHVEDELENSRRFLEKKVAERTSDLKALNDELNREMQDRAKAEKEIETQKALLEAVILQSSVPMVLVSYPDMKIQIYNQACREILGVTDEPDITGLSLFEVNKTWQDISLDGREISLDKMPLALALQGIKTEKQEMKVRRKDGTIHYTLIDGVPIFDRDGNLIAGFIVFPDITDRKLAEQALEKRVLTLTQPMDHGDSIEFNDLFDLDEIQKIQDMFADATGVASIITHTDGTPITKASNFCDLCSNIIRKTEKGLTNCYKSDSVVGGHNPDGPIVQPCLSGGLWDAGASITVGGKHVANWLIGQVRNEAQSEEKMLEYAREIGAGEKEFLDAFRKVPTMSKQQFQQVADALYMISNQISTLAYQNLQQARFISERKEAEEKLRKSRADLMEAQRIAHFGSWEWDVKTGEVKWSDEIYNIFGLDRSFVPQIDSILALSPPEEQGIAKELLDWSIQNKKPGNYEQNFYRPDGTMGTYYSTFEGKYDKEGNLVRMVGVAHDITERKRAEKALKQSEERYRLIAENVTDVIWTMNMDLQFTYVSPSIARLRGYTAEEAMAQSLDEMMTPESMEKSITLLTSLLSCAEKGDENAWKPVTLEIEQYHKDGSTIWTQTTANVLKGKGNQPSGIIGVTRDISERKKAEMAVLESEARYRTLVENAPDAIVVLDLDSGKFIDTNQNAERLYGLSRDEILKVGPAELSPPFQPDGRPSKDAAMAYVMEAFEGGFPFFEWTHLNKNTNDEIQCEIRLVRIPSSDRKLVRGSVIDITKQKRAEKELNQKTEELNRFFSASLDLLAIADTDGYFRRLNPQWTEILGYKLEDLEGKRFLDFVHPDDQQATMDAVFKLSDQKAVLNFTNRYRCKDGSYRWIEWRSIPSGKLIFAAARDITDRLETEALLRAQRDLAFKLSKAGALSETLDVCLDAAIAIAKMDSGGLYLVDEQSQSLTLQVSKGFSPQFEKYSSHYDGDSEKAYLAKLGNPIYFENNQFDRIFKKFKDAEGLKSMALVPVSNEGRIIAGINVSSHTRDTIPQQVRTALEGMTSQIGSSIARAKVRQLLAESEEKLRSLIEYSPDIISTVDLEGRILFMNNFIAEIGSEEVIGKKVYDLVPEEFHQTISECFDQVIQSKQPGKYDTAVKTIEGGLRWFETRIGPIIHGDKIEALTLISTEITEKKLAEEENIKARTIIENSPAMAWIVNLKTSSVEYINEPLELFFGKSLEEWKKTPMLWHKAILPEDRGVLSEQITKLYEQGEINTEYRILIDDTIKWMNTNLQLLRDEEGKPSFIIGISQDITERKQAEEERSAHIFFLQSLEKIDRVMHGSADLDKMLHNVIEEVLNIFECDRTWLLYPCDPDSPTFQIPFEISRPEFPSPIEAIENIPMNPETKKEFKILLETKQILTYGPGNNEPVPIDITETHGVLSMMTISIHPKLGKPWVLGIHQCSHPRVWTEQEKRLFQEVARRIADSLSSLLFLRDLTASEERYRLLAENASDVIWTRDMTLNMTYISPSVRLLRGFSVEEVMEQSIEETMTPESLSATMKIFTEEIEKENEKGNDPKRSRIMEHEMLHKDGHTVWVETTVSFIRDENGKPIGMLGMSRDISERKRAEKERETLEEQLRQSQKMEAIGRLAGGVAHDFNNIMTGITGYAEMVLQGIEPGDPMRADIEEIRRAGERAAGLTNQLLAFSRKQVIAPKVIRPNEIIERSEKMLRRIIGEDIDLMFSPGKKLGRIKADPAQVDQILVNLAVNARDAMPTGGQLTIETHNTTIDETYCKIHTDAVPGEFVMLAVSDSGHGMDEETKNQIFEPFFTTKGKDKGTGLGLATVYGIVKQNNGFVNVYSELEVGSTFKIFFPRVYEEAESLGAMTEDRQPEGNETILLVEDEEMVRGLARRILERQGYTIIEAPDGGKAYLECTKHQGTIHLLLTDVVMPTMNGRELYEKLKEMRPDLKALFMSGYTENVIAHHGVLESGTQFIQKPFTIEALARKVRQVLDKE